MTIKEPDALLLKTETEMNLHVFILISFVIRQYFSLVSVFLKEYCLYLVSV